MTLLNKILEGKPVREAIDEFAGISDDELSEIKAVVDDLLKSNHAGAFYDIKVEPYGTGFKLIFKPNELGLINLEQGVKERFVNGLGWEQLDVDELKNGTVIHYYR